MKHFLFLVTCLMLAGCVIAQKKYVIPKGEGLNSRITRQDVLASGGVCNETGICRDLVNKQTFDCTAEASCFPKSLQVKP
jgi:hypothetical protein